MKEEVIIELIFSFIIGLILFIKICQTANRARDIRDILINKPSSKTQYLKLIVDERYEEAERLICDDMAEDFLNLYNLNYDQLKAETQEERWKEKIEKVLKSYEPYFKAMGREIPERYKNMTRERIADLRKLRLYAQTHDERTTY